jgi:hypothetical protein
MPFKLKLPAFNRNKSAPATVSSSLPSDISVESTSPPTTESVSDPPNLTETTQIKPFDCKSQSIAPFQDEFDLQILREPTSSANVTNDDSINIVFVHGLGGRSCETWTNERYNFFWPAFLPKAKGLENLRVMTFGYDATWQNLWKIWQGKTELDIANFASQLLNRLRVHYDEYPDVIHC